MRVKDGLITYSHNERGRDSPAENLVLLAVAVGQGSESAAIATGNISSLISAEDIES